MVLCMKITGKRQMDNVQTQAKRDNGTPFSSVPIEITVSVGRARPLVRELLQLAEGSVLQLDKRLEDPVELFVGEN